MKGKVSCINSQEENYLCLVYLCCMLAFARMQIPGLPSCAMSLVPSGFISSSRALHERSCTDCSLGMGVEAVQLLSCGRI